MGGGGVTEVAAKDIENNILYVCDEEHRYHLKSIKCTVTKFNWINKPVNNKFSCKAKFRYRQASKEVDVVVDNDIITVVYDYGVESVTPGQACVLYIENECIGGGIINKVYNDKNQEMVYLRG